MLICLLVLRVAGTPQTRSLVSFSRNPMSFHRSFLHFDSCHKAVHPLRVRCRRQRRDERTPILLRCSAAPSVAPRQHTSPAPSAATGKHTAILFCTVGRVFTCTFPSPRPSCSCRCRCLGPPSLAASSALGASLAGTPCVEHDPYTALASPTPS